MDSEQERRPTFPPEWVDLTSTGRREVVATILAGRISTGSSRPELGHHGSIVRGAGSRKADRVRRPLMRLLELSSIGPGRRRHRTSGPDPQPVTLQTPGIDGDPAAVALA